MILDTGALVAVDRGGFELAKLLRARDDDITIAAVTAAELLQGVELAADESATRRRQGFVDAVLAVVPVDDYTLDVARVHARLLACTRRLGKPRGAHDLIIAATAVATNRTVVTTDARASFDELPGVAMEMIPTP
ncbi:PIN domain-containing protein [Streptomyces sp. TR06-5]|uniref:PIN domain-containing protein n=1 Tax=unclassified Streptomyces TaxID=2593676 RepID=UPI0039A2BE51